MLTTEQKEEIARNVAESVRGQHEIYPLMPEEIDTIYTVLCAAGMDADEVRAIMVAAGVEKPINSSVNLQSA